MIGLLANIIVEPSEAWPVVAAGLGSAVIVSLFNLRVARKQRQADSDRLDQQLAHDRKMREKQQEIDAARFEQQLAHDREMRRQQDAHDREMRDLQNLRETLTPIVARALDWDAFNKLHLRLKVDGTQPIDDATWGSDIVPLVSEVADLSESLRRGSRTLVILAGPEAPVALKLKEVANDGDALVHLARLRAQEGRTTPDIQASLDGLLNQYGYDHARFIEAANEAVRWGEAESPTD
jgi:hypothetical protein